MGSRRRIIHPVCARCRGPRDTVLRIVRPFCGWCEPPVEQDRPVPRWCWITVLTGRTVLYSGTHQVVIGLAAAGFTYGIGTLIGVTITG